MTRAVAFAAGAAAAFLLTLPAAAEIKMTGTFTASRDCPATTAARKDVNPGNLRLSPGKSYKLLGRNRDPATHYLIAIPDGNPAQRWVAMTCGTLDGGGKAAKPGKAAEAPPTAADTTFYVLALSWQPAFCEGYPDKAECRPQDPAAASSTRLSLHGLWPQPSRVTYCNVDKAVADTDRTHHWYELPEPSLSPETKAALDQAMPGTRSVLERHEWIKHGTCYPGVNAETYFKDAVRLTAAVNASPVQAFLAANIGRQIDATALRAKFDEAFGKGAGERVKLSCERDGARQLIVEITLGLKGDISAGTPLPQLVAAAPATDPGCPGGLVDPAGLQ